MESLVPVFLAVIALTAVLQTGFVIALAVAARRLDQRMAEMERQVERSVVPAVGKVAALSQTALDLSRKAVTTYPKVDRAISRVTHSVEQTVDETSRRLQDAMEGAAERVEGAVDARVRRASPRLSNAVAFARGLQKGLRVWRALGGNGSGAY